DLSVATGVILFVLRVVSFPRDTPVTVSYIIRTEGLFFLLAFGPAVVMTVFVLRGSRAGRMLALAMAPPYLLGQWQILDPHGYGWTGYEAGWMGVVRPVMVLVSMGLYVAGLCVLPKDERDGPTIWAGSVLTGLGWLAIEHGMLIGATRDEADPLFAGVQITAANLASVAAVLHAYSWVIAFITYALAIVHGRRAATIVLALPYLLVLVFTSLVSPFDFERGGATLVGPEEPPWYATVYWISCVVLFAGLWFSGSSRFVARPGAQR
ncbi:hypothetical protein ACWEPC_43695, partial [Nonomuraea sp. NPDC004297]